MAGTEAIVAARLAQPAVEAGSKAVGNCLGRKYDYVKHIKKNFEKLQREKQSLMDKKEDVLRQLENNSLTREETQEWGTWRRQVSDIVGEIRDLGDDYENKPSRCLCGLCPYRALHKLGKRIVKKTKEAEALKENLSRITIMQETAPNPRGNRYNDVRIVEYSSFNSHVAKLLGWLNEEGIMRICIHGPPGVGKTTIMKTVHDRLLRQTRHIFRATGTRENIQAVIWKGLGMTMDGNSDADQRATKISEMLNGKKFVLFLDDVDPRVLGDLQSVGIPPDHKLGKVVFACRDKYIGHTDEDIEVKTLELEDATTLFWEFARGRYSETSADIKREAKEIISRCVRVPLALILVGKELANKQAAVWRDKIEELENMSKGKWGAWEEYYRLFKLVYDKVDNEKKKCLLYWAIFPWDEEINQDYVIDCWTAEQFLGKGGLRRKRDRGIAILCHLMEKSLLQKGEMPDHFKMSYCFHMAALRIANEDPKTVTKVFIGDDGFAYDRDGWSWTKARRVLLARMTRLSLPREKPKCRAMSTLLLQENDLKEIPEQFFKNMGGLQVLGLREKEIQRLPPSISRLRKLRGLFLNNSSQVVQLPRQIGYLQNLEILDVTGIYSLPGEVGRLKNLRCLRVTFASANQNPAQGERKIFCFRNFGSSTEQMIPGNTISKLTNLEELSLDASPNIGTWNENAETIAEEIATLEKLTHLRFYFTKWESFNTFIINSKSWNSKKNQLGLTTFRLFVGQQGTAEFNVLEWSPEKHLKFSAGDEFPEGVCNVIKQAISFELIGHTAGNLTDKLPADALQELEVFIVEECSEMRSIVRGDTDTTGVAVFKCLKKLHVKGLPTLVRIWEGTIPSESFRALTTLILNDCHGITILFSLEMVVQLCQLENLQIEDCSKIEKIIEAETTVKSTVSRKEIIEAATTVDVEPTASDKEIIEAANGKEITEAATTVGPTSSRKEIIDAETTVVVEPTPPGNEIIQAATTVEPTPFGKLKNFRLCRLKSLTSICDVELNWPALETVVIETCPLLELSPRLGRMLLN